MVAFRKLFPVLAVIALLCGATSAFAQVSTGTPLACTANAGVPPVVRAEGLTELTGDLVVTCTGGNPAQPFLANFQLFLNTNITSRLLTAGGAEVSEALLMVDEPGLPRTDVNGAATAATTPFCVSPAPGSNASVAVTGAPAVSQVPGLPIGTGTAATCNNDAANGGPAGQTFQQGTYTVFRGTRQTGNPENIIVWQGIPVVPPGSNRTRTFRITNVRANAAGLGASQTLIPTQIVAYISVFPQGTLPIDNPQQTVGYVQTGMIFDVRNCNNTGGTSSSGNNVLQCRSISSDRFGDPSTGSLPSNGSTGNSIFSLRYREGFQTAFKPRSIAGQENSLPGQVFNSESGFVRTTELGTVGVADSGTRLAARFVNIPANVRIFVGTQQAPGSDSTAVLVTTDLAGASSFGVLAPGQSIPGVTGPVTINCAANGGSTPGVEIPITNGSGIAVWEVTGSNPSANETLLFYMGFAYRANQSAGAPALGQAQVIGNFAPFYPATGAPNAGSTSSTLPIPRFVARTDTNNLFRINVCQTNLLFPYVTNQFGFDTGIAISNTSADPFSSPNDRLNSGRCTINYFGLGSNGSPTTTTRQQTDREIAGGSTATFTLGSGGGFGITGNAGFQGYIIAQCDFLYAHGFAFITDGPIGQARVAEGYLALVLDGNQDVNDSLRGNALGENRGH